MPFSMKTPLIASRQATFSKGSRFRSAGATNTAKAVRLNASASQDQSVIPPSP
jgi:hypothetical protein